MQQGGGIILILVALLLMFVILQGKYDVFEEFVYKLFGLTSEPVGTIPNPIGVATEADNITREIQRAIDAANAAGKIPQF